MLPKLILNNKPGFVAEKYHKCPSYQHYLFETGVPVFGRASFWYRNQSSVITSRVVDVIRYKPNGPHTRFLAYCYLRGAYRVFDIQTVWGFRDRVTGLAQDDLLTWLESIEGRSELDSEPSQEDFASWTVPPEAPSFQQVQELLKSLGEELCRRGGAGYAYSFSVEALAASIYWNIETPKQRGQGSIRRAEVTYKRDLIHYFIDADGALEVRERWFSIKPWTLYVHRTRTKQTFERFSHLKDSLTADLFRRIDSTVPSVSPPRNHYG